MLHTETAGGASLVFSKPEKQVQVMLGHGPDGPGLHLLPHAERQAAVSLWSGPDGGTLVVGDPEGTRRAALGAAPQGGFLALYNDLGIERVGLGSANDGGALKLNWGGTACVIAGATHNGGIVAVNDAQGHPRASLPPTAEDESD